jgi:hypothetical protein
MKTSIIGICFAIICILTFNSSALADEFLYANNAGFGNDVVYKIDVTNGTVANTYTLGPGNGRGIVVVGNIMYTTIANSNNVFAYDLSTNTNLGVAFSVAGSTGLSTMAYDGTNFWIGDYSGTNHAYLYSPTGTLLKTISLSNCSGFCDGLEYLAAGGGELISNRADGCCSDLGGNRYDIYSTSGALLTSSFIDPTPACGATGGPTGIAFDGTNYFISCFNLSKLGEYSSTGTFIQDISFPNGAVEDLSANYQQVLGVPEPSTWLMIGAELICLLGASVVRKKLFA